MRRRERGKTSPWYPGALELEPRSAQGKKVCKERRLKPVTARAVTGETHHEQVFWYQTHAHAHTHPPLYPRYIQKDGKYGRTPSKRQGGDGMNVLHLPSKY